MIGDGLSRRRFLAAVAGGIPAAGALTGNGSAGSDSPTAADAAGNDATATRTVPGNG